MGPLGGPMDAKAAPTISHLKRKGYGMNALLEFMVQPMALLGLVGQTCFFSRFLIQWVASERQRRSVVPTAFWYLSLLGGFLVLIYALWRRDPIFILGQAVGLIVYTRNLVLIHAKGERDAHP